MAKTNEFKKIIYLREIANQKTFSDIVYGYLKYWNYVSAYTIIKGTNYSGSIDLYKYFERNDDIKEQLYSPFEHERVNIVNKKIIRRYFACSNGFVPVEPSISFDTQTISYLFRYYKNSADIVNENIKTVIEIVNENKIGVDGLPYAMENILGEKDNIEKVKETLFAFEKMCGKDHKTDQECWKRVDGILKTLDRERRTNCIGYYTLYKSIYCILLKMCYIQLKHNKAGLDKKMNMLCEFMHSELGKMFLAELILAKRYFEKGQNYTFFGSIQKGGKGNIDKIKNMAWDLTHLRMLEEGCTSVTDKRCEVFIPFFFTYDNRLLEVKECYELSAIAVDYENQIKFPFYSHENEISKYLEKYDSVESIIERRERSGKCDIEMLIKKYEEEVSMIR